MLIIIISAVNLLVKKAFHFAPRFFTPFLKVFIRLKSTLHNVVFFFEIESRKKKREFIFSKKRIKSKMTD